MNIRQQLVQLLNLAMVLSTAFMFWKGLGLVTNSNSPIVVVLSGSMEPAFQRGDILFLWNRDKYVDIGDVVVYEVKGKPIPIVHRVLREHKVTNKDRKVRQLLLTKGDNNPTDDLSLYAHKSNYLDRDEDILGTVKAYLPKVGYVTILITENKYAKLGLLGLMALSTLLTRE
ncbi:Signal peptidase complex catalytic subunit [Komagataella kurtzmanii]|nr:Signal peptidase complex catalytic subunit [Komagataella kurtzmanii]